MMVRVEKGGPLDDRERSELLVLGADGEGGCCMV